MALTYLVCFDIEDDKIRRKVGTALLAYGNRVQYSVFEIQVRTDSVLRKLKAELTEIIQRYGSDHDEISESVDIRFYYLNSVTLARSSTLNDAPIGLFPSATIL